MKFLKTHPFAIEAFFENSLVLTFAVPKEQLQALIPKCLELDVFNERWAFIAVAMVQTSNLRPKGFPSFLGLDFFLIGYRIFVRYTNNAGKRLRGLYIIKSETDQLKMAILGNIFTYYNYSKTDVQQKTSGNFKTIQSVKSNFSVTIEYLDEITLPDGSPFTDWKEARRFAGPLPHTYTYLKEDKTVLIIEGVREDWIPKPVKVKSYFINFLHHMKLKNVVLANAFEINKIPYYWKKGKVEKWNP